MPQQQQQQEQQEAATATSDGNSSSHKRSSSSGSKQQAKTNTANTGSATTTTGILSYFASLDHVDQCSNIQRIYETFVQACTTATTTATNNEPSSPQQLSDDPSSSPLSASTSSSLLRAKKVFFSYWKGLEALYERKFEIAIGFFTTCIGLLPAPEQSPTSTLLVVVHGLLKRVRGIAFLGHQRIKRALDEFKSSLEILNNYQQQQQQHQHPCHDVSCKTI